MKISGTLAVSVLLAFAPLAGAASFSLDPVALIHAWRSSPRSTKIRRITGLIAAGADLGDMFSTHRAVCGGPFVLNTCAPGGVGHELNPLFAPHGYLEAVRFDSFKIGLALGFTVGEEIPRLFTKDTRAFDRPFTLINVGAAAVFGGLAINNTIVANGK